MSSSHHDAHWIISKLRDIARGHRMSLDPRTACLSPSLVASVCAASPSPPSCVRRRQEKKRIDKKTPKPILPNVEKKRQFILYSVPANECLFPLWGKHIRTKELLIIGVLSAPYKMNLGLLGNTAPPHFFHPLPRLLKGWKKIQCLSRRALARLLGQPVQAAGTIKTTGRVSSSWVMVAD